MSYKNYILLLEGYVEYFNDSSHYKEHPLKVIQSNFEVNESRYSWKMIFTIFDLTSSPIIDVKELFNNMDPSQVQSIKSMFKSPDTTTVELAFIAIINEFINNPNCRFIVNDHFLKP